MKVSNNQYINTQAVDAVEKQKHELQKNSQASSFSEVLKNKLIENGQIQFSKHANTRLSTRDIQLSNDQLRRVEDGINQAYEKGIKESLVLVDNIALVVNVRSRFVITAMNKDSNVFTNIDGAVIV